MIEIALNSDKTGIFQKDISKNQKISFKYLDQIIAALKSAGLITTVSGRKSGYKLNKDMKTISVYDIYVAFNPEIRVIECINTKGKCSKEGKCASQDFWTGFNSKIKKFMKSENLYNLVETQKEKNKQDEALMYYI